MRFGSLVLALGVVSAAVLSSQDRVSITPRAHPLGVASTTANLRYDVRLIQVPVSVTDLRGQPLVDLTKEQFRIFEDDVEQPISSFSIDDAPISGMLIFDSSRSMKTRLTDTRAGVEQFLNTAMPGDEFGLIRFSDRAQVLSKFTPDTDAVLRELNGVQAKGWTALFDALYLGSQQVRKGHNQRRVLVVFSDGADNNSRYSEAEMISRLREEDLEIYAVSLYERPRTLEKVAEDTGGRAYWVRKMEELPDAIETLSRQIRSEYLIGYTPGSMQNDGKYHRIRVEVRPREGMSRLRTTWRRGYIAPE